MREGEGVGWGDEGAAQGENGGPVAGEERGVGERAAQGQNDWAMGG